MLLLQPLESADSKHAWILNHISCLFVLSFPFYLYVYALFWLSFCLLKEDDELTVGLLENSVFLFKPCKAYFYSNSYKC